MNELVLLYESQNSSIIIGWALQKDSTDTEIDGTGTCILFITYENMFQ